MVLILCGKSASGKDTILKELTKSGEFTPLISDTTRPMRDGEVDGVDYNYISQEEFLARLDNGGYIEHREYHTTVDNVPTVWYYGCPTDDYTNANKDFAVVFDVNGAKEFIAAVGAKNVIVAEITADDKVREERARVRGGFDENEWKIRLADDNERFDSSKTYNVVDFTINNTNMSLEHAVSVVIANYKDIAAIRQNSMPKKGNEKKAHTNADYDR